MLELFEKAVMTGLGAISMTQKKGEELLAEMKEKYRMSEEEGKAFLNRMQELSQEGKQRITEITEAEVKKVLERIGVVSRDEFDALKKRVEQLESERTAGA